MYTLLTGEGPFGTWKDSELQLYTRISKRQFQVPSGFGSAADLIDKVSFLPSVCLLTVCAELEFERIAVSCSCWWWIRSRGWGVQGQGSQR